MKAQSSIEFMTMVGLFMVVFLSFFAVMGDRMVSFHTKKQAQLADDMLYYVESEIMMAAEAHDGFYRNFTLPTHLAGDTYSITLNASGAIPEITVVYLEMEYAKPILANLTPESRINKPGFPNRVQRIGNIIYVN